METSSPARVQPQVEAENASLSPSAQSVISLILFVHLFCVFVALTSNMARSQLQARLVQVLRPYAQPLYLELDFEPFYLTHNDALDYDHRLEILPAGANPEDADQWAHLSGDRFRGGESFKRFQRLGRTISYFADQNENAPIGLLVTSLANQQLKQRQLEPAQIRCRRHLALTTAQVTAGSLEQRDAWGPATFREVYRAIPIVQNDQVVGVTKVDPEGQVAKPVGSSQ